MKQSIEIKFITSTYGVFTRFADSQHPFAVKLEKCLTNSFANTFFLMTSRNWNSLQASVFPDTYNLQTFKTRLYKHLHLHPLA